MSESRWTLFDTVLRHRPAGSFLWPTAAATITMIAIFLINIWSLGRVADPVLTAVWIAIWQIMGGLAMATFGVARFAKFRLTPDDWMLLSMSGSGRRLQRGIWGPPHRDAFLTYLMALPAAAFFAVMSGVPPSILALIEFNGLLWLAPLLFVEVGWSFLRLRGPLGQLISRQLRWIVPLIALSFGRVLLGRFNGLLPDMTTTAAGWTSFTLVSAAVAGVSFLGWSASGRALLPLAGERFGHIAGGVKLKDVELPRLFRQKTSRPSRPLSTNMAILEREFRATVLGVPGRMLAVFVVCVLIVTTCDALDLFKAFRQRYLVREFWDYLRFALLWIMRATALGLAAQVTVARFDQEARDQTIVPLVLAASAKRYLLTTLGVTMFVVILYFIAAFGLNAYSLALDANPWPIGRVIGVDLAVFLAAAYLCLLSATVRLAFSNWPSQLGFLLFGLLLFPIAVFVMPSLLLKACDRIDGDPDLLEQGMGKQFRIG